MRSDLLFLGSYAECLQMIPPEGENRFTGQYCLANFYLPNVSIYQSKVHI